MQNSKVKQKKVLKIVLTGGPCAGKTTALSRISEELEQKGYKVLVVPEAATILFSAGFAASENCLSLYNVQKAILLMQQANEKLFEKMAQKVNDDKIIIICDRGTLDGRAFCQKKDFDSILEALDTNEISLRNDYDAVFHLKTVADGAEEFYTCENNSARKETPEEARKADKKIINTWLGHPHLRIIDSNSDFKMKINRLMVEIYKFIGEPVPIETERKFLIEMPDIDSLVSEMKAQKSDILQTYLKTNDSYEERRIRQRGSDGNYVYYETIKKPINGISRIETERRISFKEYATLLMEADTNLKQIKKERYCFVYNDLYFELDIYPFWKDKAILEIELTEENQEVILPDFIKVIKEVTNDVRYKNNSLAKSFDIKDKL